jgi:cobalt/nickel transport system ATP-binding protein
MSHLAVTATDLRYRYLKNGPLALDGCSLTIEPGSRVALLGANGSGKSTLLLHLNGSLRPESGTVSLCGRGVAKLALYCKIPTTC